MRIEVTEYEKVYGFNIETVAQLCGQNVRKKSYIFESLRRYFGGYKYSEEKNRWRDNVHIDGLDKGRKYYTVLSIAKREDIIAYINISKKSLLLEYIRCKLLDFDFQKNMELIHEQVDMIYLGLNQKIEELGNITLDYENEGLWDMVQSSYVCGIDGERLEDIDDVELIDILMNLIQMLQGISPQKYLVLFENIDHMVSVNQYHDLYNKMDNISRQSEILFIVSLSLLRYPVITADNLEEITVYNDVDFELPDYEHTKSFLEDNYPYQREFTQEQILKVISKIVHRIGSAEYLMGIDDNVICKMINQTLLLPEKVDFTVLSGENNFLKM